MTVPLLVGTSGWQYRHWRDVLYPRQVPQRRWLEYYADAYATVENDGTFYRLPARETFDDWRSRTPDDFVMAIKASRYLTHVRRLSDPEEPVARLMRAAAGLGSRLGPVLLQLPPSLRADPGRLDACLTAIQKTRPQGEPAALGAARGARTAGAAGAPGAAGAASVTSAAGTAGAAGAAGAMGAMGAANPPGAADAAGAAGAAGAIDAGGTAGAALVADAGGSSVRVAVEPRHPSWWVEETRQVLAAHGAALCWADQLGRPVTPLWRTAAWGYLRFHQGAARPWPRYGPRALRSWLDRVQEAWPAEAPVYAYFNNDQYGAAVADSVAFAGLARQRSLDVSRTPAPPGRRAAGPASRAALVRPHRPSPAPPA